MEHTFEIGDIVMSKALSAIAGTKIYSMVYAVVPASFGFRLSIRTELGLNHTDDLELVYSKDHPVAKSALSRGKLIGRARTARTGDIIKFRSVHPLKGMKLELGEYVNDGKSEYFEIVGHPGKKFNLKAKTHKESFELCTPLELRGDIELDSYLERELVRW